MLLSVSPSQEQLDEASSLPIIVEPAPDRSNIGVVDALDRRLDMNVGILINTGAARLILHRDVEARIFLSIERAHQDFGKRIVSTVRYTESKARLLPHRDTIYPLLIFL